MEQDAAPACDNSLGQLLQAPSMHSLISGNRVVTTRRLSAPLRLQGIRVPAIAGIRANCCNRPDHASNACPRYRGTPVDAVIRVSSVAPLTICWRIDVPVFFQRLANQSANKLSGVPPKKRVLQHP